MPSKGESDHSPADEQLIGSGIAWLLLFPDRWVHRRVDLVSFLDAFTMRRQVSVDFSIPDQEAVHDFLDREPVIPLARLRKRKLVNFSAWEADGCRLPTLTRAQNGHLSALALISLARSIASQRGLGPVPTQIESDLQYVATGPAVATGSGAASVPRSIDVWYRLVTGQVTHGAFSTSLFQDRVFRSLARELAENFVLYVPHDPERSRRIVKFSHEQLLGEVEDALPRGRSKVARAFRPVSRAARAVAEGLGWLPAIYWIETLGAGETHSYHLEIEAPPELRADSGFLFAQDDHRLVSDRDVLSRRRVHMYLSQLSAEVRALGVIVLRSKRLGLVAGSWGLTVVIAVLLLVGRDQIPTLEAQDATSLFLALPGLVAAYLARPGEHEVTKRVLRGTRSLLLTAGLASFVAAAFLELGFSTETRVDAWCVTSFVVLAALGLQTITLAIAMREAWAKSARIRRSERG